MLPLYVEPGLCNERPTIIAIARPGILKRNT